MTSVFHENTSHFEPDSPRASVQGDRSNAAAERTAADDVSSIDHVHEKPPPVVPLTKKQKFKRHCGRFKWWYLGVFLILLAILLPIL
jgi:hypothetical protein